MEKGSNDLEIVKTIYTNLRLEILEKMKFSNQLLSYKLISVGAVVGFVVANRGQTAHNLLFENAAIFTGIGLAISFDLALYQNNKAIITVGTYMKRYIEPWLKSLSDPAEKEERVMWEEYISERSPKTKRMIYNIFEAANYLMTLLLIVIAAVMLSLSQPWLIVILFLLFFAEIKIAFKGLSRQ